MWNLAPALLSTVMSPPISRLSLRLIASPSPVPPNFRELEAFQLREVAKQLIQILRSNTDTGVGDPQRVPRFFLRVPLSRFAFTTTWPS